MSITESVDSYKSTDEDRYRDFYTQEASRSLLDGIYREVYGDDYPAEAAPLGFVTRFDLEWIARHIDIDPGQTLLDVGCGQGGPGLWIAQQTEATLVGVDIVSEAIQQARKMQKGFRLREAPQFKSGSFTATGLAPASVDAVMSVETLWMVLNKYVALVEMARVLRPKGRFVFVTWVAPHFPYREILEGVGFQVVAEEESPEWEERQLAVYQKILAQRDGLRQEMGEAANILISEAEHAPAGLSEGVRTLFAAEKKG